MAGAPYWKRGLKPVRHRWDDAIARMDPLEFERLIGDHYRRQGFRVEHVGTGGAGSRYDGGIDLKLYRDDEYVIVQCKRHTAMQVAHNDVHEFLGIMHTERATGAIFVNSGEYTAAALSKLEGIANFQMIDGHELRAMIGPLAESVVAAPDADARWRRDHTGVMDGPMPSPDAVVSPEALVFRTPRASVQKPVGRVQPSSTLAWWLVALVCAVAFVFLIRTLLERTAWSAGNGASAVQAVQLESLPQPSGEAPAVMDDPPVSAQPQWNAGTAAHAAPSRPQTAAEIRESQRRADEAIRLLEATTPEM